MKPFTVMFLDADGKMKTDRIVEETDNRAARIAETSGPNVDEVIQELCEKFGWTPGDKFTFAFDMKIERIGFWHRLLRDVSSLLASRYD